MPLPSTADEIPTSELRRNPLTQEELRDIRSLIGVAKKKGANHDHHGGASASASSPELLSGRRVMVPMTSKAFFEGVLQPIPPTNTNTNASFAAEEEQLIINNGGGKLVEMSRTDACDYFEKQHNQVDAVKKPVTTKPPLKKSALKSSKIKSTATTSTSTSTPNITSQSTQGNGDNVPPADVDPMPLPLMEIRETCDASGHILQSEIVNMSNTIKRIGDGLTNAPETGDDEGKQLGELLAQTLKAGEGEITKDVHVQTVQEQQEDTTSIITDSKKTKEPISDTNYEAISSRLEELERLEEEDAKSKRVNVKSSKRLQSSGWSKGFLNNTNTTKKKNRKAAAAKTKGAKPTAPAGTNDQTPTNNSTTQVSDSTTASNKSSRVSFSSSNNIKEIPRIGEMKVPPRPPPGRPVTFNPSSKGEVEVPEAVVDPFAPLSTDHVPFEENVFKGVVKERNVVAAVDRETKESTAPKKKLSRFAQQRLERGG